MMFQRVAGRLAILAVAAICIGCVAAVPPTAAPTSEASGATPAVSPASASPSPSPAPSSSPRPSASARPALQYPDNESYGTITLSFTKPARPVLSIGIECEWTNPTEVGWYHLPNDLALAGEHVYLDVNPQAVDMASVFRIGRDGSASYDADRGNAAIAVADHAADWSTGAITFTDLVPDPESAPPGPLPSPLTDWIRPLGGDPAYATLSGSLAWTCEAAPATVPTPEPTVSEAPERTVPPLPDVLLIAGDQRDAGDRLCGSYDIDGFAAGDSCGIGFTWVGPEHAVHVRTGEKLHFELPKGWHFSSWIVGWATQAEAERFRFERPDSFVDAAKGKTTDGRVLEVEAPPAGEWDVELDWMGGHGRDSTSFPSFFRVIVGG
jgi:hypothetical protein